ncbi:DegT/DnrJ/EryC1/StrS family aminotransferase [Ancylobacter pratisalsi]|uniref:DegT/DnrJ/EryC1/StrS family aminotransferase n=1 Tax=Ancylobacter pratisalsi TaxID=1745854 RepID=A0A6P1YRB7_9HYPH|nr:DegT/DnrJ/EryC1/StrS family aminotransferase [Ancylobacter pratisalsi]
MRVPFLDLKDNVAALRPALDAAFARVMDSGWFILGPELEAFEAEFAHFIGVPHAIGTGNGLDALRIALEASGVGPGDDVIVPAHTFIATWLAVTQLGAVPVAVEPAAGRFNVAADAIEAALTPRTKAIVVVHLYGEPVEMEPVLALAAARGIPVIEDAAQAHGATRHGVACGSFGHAAAFSFYPAKNLGAFGDAGALVTGDEALRQRARSLRNYGAVTKYDHAEAGINSRLDELQAALLRVVLPEIEGWNARRRAIAARYDEGLADLPGLEQPRSLPGNVPAWHLYVVRSARRAALQAALAEVGIGTQIHYPTPIYRLPPYAGLGPACETPTDRIAREALSLPMNPFLSDPQIERVIGAVRAACS